MRKILCFTAMLVLIGLVSMAQRTITGRVMDDKGAPVSSASVQIKNTQTGTVTAEDGRFSLNVPATAKILVVSAVNMGTQEIIIGNQTSISVTLSTTFSSMQEVVVVGYGTQRRKEVTGNLSSVRGSEVAEKPVQSFDQALAGKAAGVQITIPSGVLNSPPVFRIRGTNSISLSSYPLIIIDGVPSYTGDYSGTNAAGNALASINPNDIESIDIAKDAAATAIYGSRAANGVVFITTKKGRVGKTRVTYDGWVGWETPTRLPSTLNASQYLTFKTSAVNNYNSLAASMNLAPTPIAYSNPAGTDTKWNDYIYRTGFSQSHNINLSGGNEATTYYFSTGYTDQQGIIQKNNFKRLNVLFNGDSKINNFLSAGIKLSYSNESNEAATSSGSLSGEGFNTAGLGRLAIVLPPIISPYNPDGSYNLNGSAIGSSNIAGISSLSYFNPVPSLDLNRSNSENNHIQSSAYLQIKPTSWLTLKSLYGIDYLFVNNDLFWTPVAGDGYTYGGYASAWTSNYKTWLWTNTAQFDYTVAGKHNINALIGNDQQRRTTTGYGINRQTLSDPAYNLVQAGFTTNNPTGLAYGENYLLSTFGRLNYNYNQKYYVSGTVRQDEYSGLGVKKGVFWGLSGGWEVAKESFWHSIGADNVISSFRLRGSYGKVGNVSGISDYSPYSTFGSGLYGGASTLAFSSVGNNILQWETSKKTDVGIAFGLFKDKITGDIAYYDNNIDGLILNVQQSPSTGLPSAPPANVGTMYNRGFEFSLGGSPISKKDFSWTTNFNISFNKNMVTSLAPGLPSIQTTTSASETVSQTMPGYSIGYLWVIRTGGVDPGTGRRIFINSAGVPVYYSILSNSTTAAIKTYSYSTTADGTTKYVSSTGGTSITQAADGVMYANTQPKVIGGWENTLRYKGFELNAQFTYELGFYVYYGTNAGLHDQRWWNNASDVLTDAWTGKGDANKIYAMPVYGDNVSNGSAMPLDINVFKGDFLKLRTLTLSYRVPKSILNRAKIDNLRLYITGSNLAIVTKYPGPDPEVSSNGNSTTSQGVDRNTGANGRTITVGVNFSF